MNKPWVGLFLGAWVSLCDKGIFQEIEGEHAVEIAEVLGYA